MLGNKKGFQHSFSYKTRHTIQPNQTKHLLSSLISPFYTSLSPFGHPLQNSILYIFFALSCFLSSSSSIILLFLYFFVINYYYTLFSLLLPRYQGHNYFHPVLFLFPFFLSRLVLLFLRFFNYPNFSDHLITVSALLKPSPLFRWP